MLGGFPGVDRAPRRFSGDSVHHWSASPRSVSLLTRRPKNRGALTPLTLSAPRPAAHLRCSSGKCPTGRDPTPLIRNCAAAPTQKKRATCTVLLVDSLRVEECRANWTGPCGANGARTSVSDGICPQRSTMRAGTWSVPASWSTSQMAARKSRESEPTPFPMSSDCARPLATVDRAGLSGAPRIR
jgi:hypothetical protein